MSRKVWTVLAVAVLVLGLLLMVGGIVVGKNGAVVVGLCVAVAGCTQLIAWHSRDSTTAR